MPEDKAEVPKESPAKENRIAAKPESQVNPPIKAHEETEVSTTSTKAETNVDGSAKQAPDTSPPANRRLSFKRIVPVLVLLLAAAIFLTITGEWNRWIGISRS